MQIFLLSISDHFLFTAVAANQFYILERDARMTASRQAFTLVVTRPLNPPSR